MCISKNIIDLFNKNIYEKFVLDIMNESTSVFPGRYSMVQEQSSGECDFEDMETKAKYDAKLPFEEEQIKLLTDGKKHRPQIEKWIEELHDEESEFDPVKLDDSTDYKIENLKLYRIMKQAILRDKPDENIVFFLPYPITQCSPFSYFLDLFSDYLDYIYRHLKTDIDLGQRKIYTIYPASAKNIFVLRNLGDAKKEYIVSNLLERYFTYEITDCQEI